MLKSVVVKMSTTPEQFLAINERIVKGEVDTIRGTRDVLEWIDPATRDKVQCVETIYPLTDELQITVADLEHREVIGKSGEVRRIIDELISNFMEYEHGTADVEDACPDHPINLEQYSAVLNDIILQMAFTN